MCWRIIKVVHVKYSNRMFTSDAKYTFADLPKLISNVQIKITLILIHVTQQKKKVASLCPNVH